MRQDRAERTKLLNKLKSKLNERKKEGKSGTVSLNVPKKPKRIKEQAISKVSKTPRSPREKRLSTVLRGSIKWFNQRKGFGFIICEDDGKDYFLHHSNIEGDISEGDKVKFKAESTARGLSATNVSKQK